MKPTRHEMCDKRALTPYAQKPLITLLGNFKSFEHNPAHLQKDIAHIHYIYKSIFGYLPQHEHQPLENTRFCMPQTLSKALYKVDQIYFRANLYLVGKVYICMYIYIYVYSGISFQSS